MCFRTRHHDEPESRLCACPPAHLLMPPPAASPTCRSFRSRCTSFRDCHLLPGAPACWPACSPTCTAHDLPSMPATICTPPTAHTLASYPLHPPRRALHALAAAGAGRGQRHPLRDLWRGLHVLEGAQLCPPAQLWVRRVAAPPCTALRHPAFPGGGAPCLGMGTADCC